MTEQTIESICQEIGKIVPFVSHYESNLGGTKSFFISFSKEKKEDWPNKIFQNSTYCTLFLNNRNGKVSCEVTSTDYRLKRMRAFTCELSKVQGKILKYVKENFA